jgi:oxygen-independent coproporphyrinogen-3 oxidase
MSPEALPGLYVHVPFCSALCPYCDFAVNVGTAERRKRFAERLLAEADLVEPEPTRCFDTLYFGGGTPSSLDPESLVAIVGRLSSWLLPGCRLFLEANPEDVREETLRALREAGIHTLSLGVQSLQPESLRFLGRRHSDDEARRAVELAREAGFGTLSIDLIYGLPGQTAGDWRRDLEDALRLSPDHLSCYQLTIHEGTLFGRRKREGGLVETEPDVEADLFRLTHDVSADHGYEGYEVSNFARGREHRSRHNEKYWAHAPYLGLGPSAHSFDGTSRRWNERSFFDWERVVAAGRVPVAGRELLGDDDLLVETLMLRLRTRDGIDLRSVRERFGVDLRESNRALIERAVEDGLLVSDGFVLKPTTAGLAVADSLAGSFRWLS